MNNMNDSNNTDSFFAYNPLGFMQNFLNQDTVKNMFRTWTHTNNLDMSKFTTQNFSNINFSALSDILKKNSDVLSEAGKMASESFQSISQKGSDSFQKNATEMFNSMKDAISAGDAKQLNDSTQKYFKKSVENNISNTKEMMDVASKASMEIMDMIGKNITENLHKMFDNKHKK